MGMPEADSINVEVEVYVCPTEDIEKVKSAVNNLITNLSFEIEESSEGVKILFGRADGINSLRNFKDLLKRERIRYAARATILSNMAHNSVIFYLNKQAAFANRISFSLPNAESPLGPIKVKVKSEKLSSLIDWLVSSTGNSRN